MTDTPRLTLPLLAAGQAQKHVTHNDALTRLDALVHLAVQSRSQTTPPASPDALAAYIVPPAGTGVFAGRTDDLAIFEDGGWSFLEPRPGWQAWIADEAEHHVWTGTQWRRSQPSSAIGASLWGVNIAADTTNRLAVSSPATLLSHAGSDHRLTLNKAAAANTASLILQDGFSGRAEIGLTGDDDLHMKVSADGAAWTQALTIDRTTGVVALPASPWARETARQNLLINGDMQVNQRGFAGGALAAGIYAFDRWKADTGGANLSRSGFDLTLTSGAIVQPVEPALWGVGSFALTPLTLSVEDLAGGNLTVGIGSVSGTITPGSGRRSVTLTPAAGDSGTLAIRLAPASGAVTLRRIKLERGNAASPCRGTSARCRKARHSAGATTAGSTARCCSTPTKARAEPANRRSRCRRRCGSPPPSALRSAPKPTAPIAA
ncbi:MAG: DUF2793 domain-containing protein [Beijerinckiaceae bacterium]|nr:DUF2793 domain-containing protein [Beijerinckiaceae bacterium]